MTRVEAFAEMAARHEMSTADMQEALALLLGELINRCGPAGVPVRAQEDIITAPVRGNKPPGG